MSTGPAPEPSLPGAVPGRHGVDYSAYNVLDVDGLRRAGVTFAARYLSHDAHKNLTPSEAQRLSEGGIDVVVVWETTANRALDGHAAGAADARDAHAQANSCGMPAGRPIYFAVDFDATPAQKPAIADYLRGAASVLGPARVGVYGGYWVTSYCLAERVASWAWQTAAWSGGKRDPGAHLYQRQDGVTVAGISCDLDTACKQDFGQWRRHPGVEPPFPFSPDDYLGLARPDPHCHWGATPADREAVAKWQAQMSHRGWSLPATGVYAKQSQRVCRQFQQEKGLSVDGAVGPTTWRACWAAPVT